MNTNLPYPATLPVSPAAAARTKPLWVAIGILSACVLAMAASLVHISQKPKESAAAHLLPGMNANALTMQSGESIPAARSLTPQESVVTSPAAAPASVVTAPAPAAKPVVIYREKPVPARTHSAQNAPEKVAKPPSRPADAPVVASAYPPVASTVPVAAPVAEPPKPVCATCGTVESVTPVTRDGQGSGVGVVAGGVLGGVLGNQVGKGNGRTLGTIAGAGLGGWAGHTIEKKMNKQTVYSVRVRMEDGSSRVMEQKAAPAVGSKVTVEGGVMRSAEGVVYENAPPVARQRPRSPDINNTGYGGGAG